jgi:hypothetical protein
MRRIGATGRQGDASGILPCRSRSGGHATQFKTIIKLEVSRSEQGGHTVKGVQFVVDGSGRKTAVQIDLKKQGRL